MASHARQQYYADGETLKKEAREFAMTDELKQKLDSIEWGAEVNVIEDVKVNGVSLEVVDKSVDVLVPLVIDNLYTVDGDNALSAKQGKILYDYIQNLQSRGRYLSNWNTATGLPSTNPAQSPYEYRSGDYFVVSAVASEGGTNYRPDGSSYTIGVASTTVETENVKVTDIYLYDGTNWLLLTNSTREIPIDDALSTTSTNPVENRVVTNAINTKQDKLIAGNNIQIAQDGKTISATDTTYSAGTNVNIDANNVISAVDTTYTAGANVNIDANNVISATDTVYAEGTGIDITNNTISNEGVLTVNGSNGNVTVNDVKVAATAPANPTEGLVWYDTTNDILKMYDGTNWNPVGENDSAVWGNITGTLSNQTDLQNALDNKITKEDWNEITIGNMGFGLYSEDYSSNTIHMSVSPDDIQIDKMAGMTNENINLTLRDRLDFSKNNPSLSLRHGIVDESLGTMDNRTVEYDTDGIDFISKLWNGSETITTNKSYKFDETSNGIVRFADLDTDRLKSFYLPSDVTTAAALATAQEAYEYMAVGLPVLRMGSMYDTAPGTLTFFPVKKVNSGESGTMIFLSTQLSKATTGGYTMVFQDRVEFTVTNGQVTSITTQFTNSNSTLFRFLETNTNYSSTYTPSYSGSPTNKKYVDKWDTAVSATAPTTDLYEGKLWYDKTTDVLYSYDGSNWNATGKVYTAGTGIDITNDVISCTLNPVTVSQTAPANPESGDLWFNTTKQTLNLYNGTSWVLVGPEIVPITKAAYDLLSSADKNDGRFYLITDNDGTIYVEWANVQNAPISAGTTAPSSPNEGDIWYDTTNDILKVYDGTNWNGVGQGSGDVVGPNSATDGHVAVFDGATGKIIKDGGALPEASNVKAFVLSGSTGTTAFAEAQAIYDWALAGNVAIVKSNGRNYVSNGADSSGVKLRGEFMRQDYNSGKSAIWCNGKSIIVSNGTVTRIQDEMFSSSYILRTGYDYSTPYEPEYDGSPATKKYVDDNTKAVSGVSTTQPSNPVAGSTYYDTTNNVLMVYDGTNWNAAGKTYTAGTNISIDANNVISADTQFVVVNALPTIAQADENKVYILGPIGTGADKYEEWIVAEKNVPFTSASPITKYTLSGSGEGGYGEYWNAGASEGVTNVYMGLDNVEYTGDINYADAFDENSSDTTYSLIDNHMPYIPVDEFTSEDVLFEIPVVGSNFNSAYTFSVDIYTSTSPLRLATEPVKEWVKIGETSIDLSNKQDKATSGSAAPATTPSYIGQQYVDITNDMLYIATGTSSSSDWTLVGANTGVEVQVISQSDYDALTEAEKNADVIYLITGGSGGLTVAWTNVTGKPDLIINPSGGTAGQLLAKTANGYEWTTVNSATWGNISGTLSNQTDLQTALDAKQDELNAGAGISIGDVTINGRKGPSPDGFHVPSTTEWQGLNTIMTSLSLTTGDNWRINLHMPFAGSRNYSSAALGFQGSNGYYWSSSPYGSGYPNYARYLYLDSSSVYADYINYRAYGLSVRCFKNSYEAPDSTWTVVQGTLGSAGIFWNQSQGLISITDGSTGYTIMDKNLGATTVYNDGDTLTQANMGNMYQWGNNYGFPSTGTITNTSSTQVDASAYGPTNPYSSDTFITGSNDWSSVSNDDLWGDTTGTITQENVISNTGVLSVNGQTGNVTISSGGMQLAPDSPLKPTYFWYGTEEQYQALSQYYTVEEGDTVYYTI